MTPPAPFSPVAADWQREQQTIRAVREAVFVREQGISRALEWDGRDDACEHVLVFDGTGLAIATGRLQADGRIGRMAVLREWRGNGIGSSILRFLVNRAVALGLNEVYLHAQAQAADFYRAAGFRQCGEVFDEAGIPHVRMTCPADRVQPRLKTGRVDGCE